MDAAGAVDAKTAPTAPWTPLTRRPQRPQPFIWRGSVLVTDGGQFLLSLDSLSAPQVHQTLRIIVVAVPRDDGSRQTPLVIVNPVISVLESEPVENWEGCASLPEVRGPVSRARSIAVRALDRTGASLQIRLNGLGARIVQHGTDHLDGVLFVDRMRTFESLVFREYAPPDANLL